MTVTVNDMTVTVNDMTVTVRCRVKEEEDKTTIVKKENIRHHFDEQNTID